MNRLVHTISLLGALAALGVSIWRDAGPLDALKRTVFAYLGLFIVFAALGLAFRAGVLAENRPAPPPGGQPKDGGTRPPR